MKSFIFVLLVVAIPALSPAYAAENCDRECLRGFITRYLDALVSHDPKALPASNNVRFTEDTVEKKVGEGLWKTASQVRPYRQDILDVRQGVAASQVVVEENGSPDMLMLRLKIVDQKITEIETQVTRNQKEGAIFEVKALQSPNKVMSEVPLKSELPLRDEAIKIAQLYPAGLKIGSFTAVDAPFASAAYRLENGRITAGPGCSRAGCENIKTQTIMKHPAITTRVIAVDEQLGIALLRMNFGDTGSYGPGNALIVWEAFKVYGGQIHAVEAFMRVMPATAGSGWD
jgi:hypothetical protein